MLSKHLATQQVHRGCAALWARSGSQQAPKGQEVSRGCSGALAPEASELHSISVLSGSSFRAAGGGGASRWGRTKLVGVNERRARQEGVRGDTMDTMESGQPRERSGALGRSPGPQGPCSAQQAPSSSAGAQGLGSALGALRLSAGAQGPCGKQGALRRPGAIQRSEAQAPSKHLGLCSTLAALRHSAGAQQAPTGLAALKGRSDTHKALRGCAALGRRSAAGA